MQLQVNESDWKLFRKKLPGWQESHMEKLTQEYAVILAGSGPASDKFWELEKRINEDKRHVGVVATMSRSKMYQNMMALFDEGVITLDDLDEFSDELKGRFAFLFKRNPEES